MRILTAIVFLMINMGAGEPGSPFSRLVDSINAWTEYDFVDNIVSQRSRINGDIEIKDYSIMSLENILCNHLRNFSFDSNQDTIIIDLSDFDYSHTPYRIAAYSSKKMVRYKYIERNLFGKYSSRYKTIVFGRSSDRYPFFNAIYNNDLEAFCSFYDGYGIPNTKLHSVIPREIYRIEVKDGEVQSVSKWVF